MSKPNPSDEERQRTPHQIRWGDADWENIVRLAEELSAETGDDVTPTGVIRRATRAYLDAHLNGRRRK